MSYNEKYDKKNPKSIENYAKKIIGYTFENVIELREKEYKELSIGEVKESILLYYGN